MITALVRKPVVLLLVLFVAGAALFVVFRAVYGCDGPYGYSCDPATDDCSVDLDAWSNKWTADKCHLGSGRWCDSCASRGEAKSCVGGCREGGGGPNPCLVKDANGKSLCCDNTNVGSPTYNPNNGYCSGSCDGTCSYDAGSGNWQTASCSPPCQHIDSITLTFDDGSGPSRGPVNLPNTAVQQTGTLAWRPGAYRGGTPSCTARCAYTNTGETAPCSEFSGSLPPSGSQTVTPTTSVAYTITCTLGNTVNSSVHVNVRRYRCLFGVCQGSSRGQIKYFNYSYQNSCKLGCKSLLPEW